MGSFLLPCLGRELRPAGAHAAYPAEAVCGWPQAPLQQGAGDRSCAGGLRAWRAGSHRHGQFPQLTPNAIRTHRADHNGDRTVAYQLSSRSPSQHSHGVKAHGCQCKPGNAREEPPIDQIGNYNRRRGTDSTNHEGATRHGLHQRVSAGELLGVIIRGRAARKRPDTLLKIAGLFSYAVESPGS
jgi:hypothetical protein